MSAPPSAVAVSAATARKGAIALFAVSSLWGLGPILYFALKMVNPLEVVAERIVWGVPLAGLAVVLSGRAADSWRLLRQPRALVALVGSALAISVNWLVFIYASGHGMMLQSSAGGYLTPLVTVGLGALVLGERFTGRQMVALATMMLAVGLLIDGIGGVPWVTILLPLSWGSYSLLRKMVAVDSMVGLFIETLVLLPAALIAVGVFEAHHTGSLGLFWRGEQTLGVILLLTVVMPLWTVIPLSLFSYAARRLPLGTVGVVQYASPTIQFVLAIFWFHERFSLTHALAFATLWVGIVLFLWPRRPRISVTSPPAVS